MPLIAWILVAYFVVGGFISLTSLVAKGMKAAKDTASAAATTISILLTAALYGWMVWAVVRLATT